MRYFYFIIILFICYQSDSQTLHILETDSSDFPLMRAKFYLTDEEGERIDKFYLRDFSITENGQIRNIISVNCKQQFVLDTVSNLLTFDISGSMEGNNFKIAKDAAYTWVEELPLNIGECAITTFSETNNLEQDFTDDKYLLQNTIYSLQHIQDTTVGTNFDAAFLHREAGGLFLLENARHKKIMILITDGNAGGSENVIIYRAKNYKVAVYCIILNAPCPDILKNIANASKGKCFANITSAVQAREAFDEILKSTNQMNPCEIVWESSYFCEADSVDVEIKYENATTASFSYYTPESSISSLTIEPEGLSFINRPIGIEIKSKIEVTAIGPDFNISDIKVNNPNFEISPKSFHINENDKFFLTVTFTPQDSNFQSADFILEAEPCPLSFKAISYYSGHIPDKNSIKLLAPNGGELYYAGTDTLIQWEGIESDDSVDIKFSKDNGINWTDIANDQINLEYNWKIDKDISSNECLVSVSYHNEVNPELEWYKTMGGNSWESIRSIDNILDGGFIIASSTTSIDGQISNNHGKRDIWLTKTDLFGALEWEKSFGGSNIDDVSDIKQTDDGGYILVGFTNSEDIPETTYNGSYDIWVIKLDSDANIEWNRLLGGSGNDLPFSVIPDVDGGYFILATTNSNDGDIPNSLGQTDLWLIKLNANGKTDWQKRLGGSGNDYAGEAISTSDGAYIISGYTYSDDGDITTNQGDSDAWIINLDQSGNIKWKHTYGGSQFDSALSIEETHDGGFIFIGASASIDGDVSSNYGSNDIWVVKLSNKGSIEWQKSYGGSKEDFPTAIKQLDDDGFIIFSYTWSSDIDLSENKGLTDIWICKIDKKGTLKWEKTYGGNSVDILACCHKSIDNGFIFGGSTNSVNGDFSQKFSQTDNLLIKISADDSIFLSDTSDNVFSIVRPEVTGNDIDFGSVLINSSKDSNFVSFIENITPWPCRIDSIYITGEDSAYFKLLSPLPSYHIAGNTKQYSRLQFTPDEVRLFEAQLVIISQTDTLRQRIRGEGDETKIIVLNNEIDFGTVKVGSHKDSLNLITIANLSNSAVDITKTEITGVNASDYSILSGAAPFTLNAGDTCRMDLRYTSNDVGQSTGTLLFYFNSHNSPAQVNLKAAGISPNTIDISDIHFPNQQIGETNDSTINNYFYNTGNYTNTVEDVYLKDGDIDQFEIKNLSLPFSLDANQSQNLEISFSPTSSGTKHTNLYMICQGETIVVNINGRTIHEGIEMITSDIDYGTLELGQQLDSIKIPLLRNIGTEDLIISDVDLTGTDIQDFDLGSGFQSAILNSEDTLFVDLAFNPKTIGTKSVNISIIHNISANPDIVQVTGEAIESIIPRLSISIPNIEAETGEIIYLPLILEESENMSKLVSDGLIANLSFNSYVMLPIEMTPEISGNKGYLQTEEFSINRNIGDTLTLIPFKVMLGDKEISPIEFEKLIPNDNMLIIDTKSGSLKISDLCEQGGKRLVNPEGIMGISNLSPNPAETVLQIDFSVIEKGNTTISLIDMLGKTVSIIFDENISEFKDMKVVKDISHISAGYYFIQFKTLTYVERKKGFDCEVDKYKTKITKRM